MTGSKPDPNRLSFGEVSIDFAGRRLMRGDVEQPLAVWALSVPARVRQRVGGFDAEWSGIP